MAIGPVANGGWYIYGHDSRGQSVSYDKIEASSQSIPSC